MYDFSTQIIMSCYQCCVHALSNEILPGGANINTDYKQY